MRAEGRRWESIIIVDVQQGFIVDDATGRAADAIGEYLGGTACSAAEVIATVYRNHPGSPCSVLMDWHGCSSQPDMTVPSAIARHVDRVIEKDTYGLSPAEPGVSGGDGPTLVIGIDTDVCVLMIAGLLFDAGIDVYVAQNLCASSGGEASHQSGINALSRIPGKDRILSV